MDDRVHLDAGHSLRRREHFDAVRVPDAAQRRRRPDRPTPFRHDLPLAFVLREIRLRVPVDVHADGDDGRPLSRRQRAHDRVQVLCLDGAVVATERIDERHDHRTAAERRERDGRAVLVGEAESRRETLARRPRRRRSVEQRLDARRRARRTACEVQRGGDRGEDEHRGAENPAQPGHGSRIFFSSSAPVDCDRGGATPPFSRPACRRLPRGARDAAHRRR